MNGWLRPIALRLVERGPSLMGSRVRTEDIRQPQAFLGQARLRPSYELGRPIAHLGQGPKCCNSPDGTKCFDHATGDCINTWNSTAATPGAPSCVQNPQGEFVHPDCWTPPLQLGARARRIPFYNLGRGPMMGQAEPPAGQKLIACVNGPDLYDIYNPDMSLVARNVLSPNAQYPDAQIDFAQFPPCPVPQATGAGGLCDVPHEYLAPKDPNGPQGKPVLACFNTRGVTLFDYVTGAVIGTHLNAACLSLLSDVTRAPEGDSRCTEGSAPAVTPPSGGGSDVTPPGGGSQVTTPPSGGTEEIKPPIGGGVSPGTGPEPIPATGAGSFVPVLPPPQNMTTASSPTGAFPGQPFAAMPPPQKPIPIAKAPAPLLPACPLGPVPLRQWVEGCLG